MEVIKPLKCPSIACGCRTNVVTVVG